jgi:uncharacterized small protein (DUF1192 family)
LTDVPDTEQRATESLAGELLSVAELNDQIVSVVEETSALD